MRLYVVINTVGIMLRYVALIMLLPVIFALNINIRIVILESIIAGPGLIFK